MANPVILCDAMLGGLARWIRAAGYDAEFVYGIDDRALISQARGNGGIILSSDEKLFERNVIKDGTVKALFVPRDMTKHEQLAFVLKKLNLPVLPIPRCMACGGELIEIPKDQLRGLIPPKAYAAFGRFWRCQRCGKVFWRGTHWQKISKVLSTLRR